ncbi:transcription antitermination factor NusB [Corynebacterium uropygiale]|uniref:Transcription antitermination protein NusB n=1 Tax=Corynebacterium uropygiale TaxID=1775911 RepID=A0A9X1TXV4_9CORY|nr:transcription antitermination factor NusB [Corynebacterium uropygiale]
MEKNSRKNNRRHGARYRARRRAVDILFEAEARDIDPVAIVEDRVELSRRPDQPVKPIADYTRTIVAGVAVELDRIDDVLDAVLADDWELHRIPAVDRAILRMSAWELLFNPDVPRPTAVVEGVELASEYADEEASSYINALLDDVAKKAEHFREEFQREDEEAEGSEEPESTPTEDATEEPAEAPAPETEVAVETPDTPENPENSEPQEPEESPQES